MKFGNAKEFPAIWEFAQLCIFFCLEVMIKNVSCCAALKKTFLTQFPNFHWVWPVFFPLVVIKNECFSLKKFGLKMQQHLLSVFWEKRFVRCFFGLLTKKWAHRLILKMTEKVDQVLRFKMNSKICLKSPGQIMLRPGRKKCCILLKAGKTQREREREREREMWTHFAFAWCGYVTQPNWWPHFWWHFTVVQS